MKIHTVAKYREAKNFVQELIKRYDALTDVGRRHATNLQSNIQDWGKEVKEFETAHPKKEGRTFELSNGKRMCDECCNGDRCDDPTHRYRGDCWYCLGTGYNASC